MRGGIVLAAGLSRRFPGKLFREVEGKSILTWVIEAFTASSIDRVVVVANSSNASLLEGIPRIEIAINDKPEMGMIRSVQIGLSKLMDADAVVLSPGDHPFITKDDIELLLSNYVEGRDLIVLTHDGKMGHPILMGKSIFPEVMQLDDQHEGLKYLLRTHRVTTVESSNAGILVDIDTEADLELFHDFARRLP